MWKAYKKWLQEIRAQVDVDEKRLQISDGEISYTDTGTGNPVLFVHGSIGGYGSGPMFMSWLCGHGFRVICPSRPGFTHVPLRHGRTLVQQAEYLYEILEKLDITKCSIIAHSGGGPVALELLEKFPETFDKVIFLTAVGHKTKLTSLFAVKLFFNRPVIFFLYLLKRFLPDVYLWICVAHLKLDWSAIKANASYQKQLLFHMESSFDAHLHRQGLCNDARQFRRIISKAPCSYNVPAMIIYATNDKRTGGTHGPYLRKLFCDSQIVYSDTGGHHPLVSRDAQNFMKEIITFLK